MIRVLIIDDEPLARKIIQNYLIDFSEFELIGECKDGFEGLKMIQELNPDLVFLDIQMPKITGFEMLELIPDPPKIIFSTAYDEFAIKAFEANAIDYLLKPFTKERFSAALDKFKAMSATSQALKKLLSDNSYSPILTNRIVVKDSNEIKIIPLDEIYSIEAYDDYVKIHTKSKIHLKYQRISKMENVLKNQHFVQIHRSHIINLNYLTRIESFEKGSYIAILSNETRIPISRSNYTNLKNQLGI